MTSSHLDSLAGLSILNVPFSLQLLYEEHRIVLDQELHFWQRWEAVTFYLTSLIQRKFALQPRPQQLKLEVRRSVTKYGTPAVRSSVAPQQVAALLF